MSVTNLSAVADVTPEVWAKRTLRDSLVRSFWGRFCGKPGSGAPIAQQFELLGGPGQILHIPTSVPLSGAGKTEEQTLEGSEEALSLGAMKVCPVFYRHAVRYGRLANQRAAVELMGEARVRLAEWGAAKLDANRWASFKASALPSPLGSETYTPNKFFAKSSATSVDDLVAADKLTVAAIRRLRVAMIEQGAEAMTDSEGREFFGLAIHPRQSYDLKGDTALSAMMESAGPRGDANPIFTGAIGRIDGIVLYEHSSVPVAVNANAAPAACATSICFGKEAFVEGVGEEPIWIGDSFDYRSESGISFGFSAHARRALEKQSMLVYTSAVKP